MPQTRGQFFDDISRLMTDAAGIAEGARREVETLARSQFERFAAGMNFVSRDEFEAVREMAALARARKREVGSANRRARGQAVAGRVGQALNRRSV